MKSHTLHILAGVALSLFLFILLHALYIGVSTFPTELDSIMYHIPIAESYLNGKIFSSPVSPILHRFFPGASEGILALLILFHIPLNIYNVLGAAALCLACYLLGKRAGLGNSFALLFAAGFSSLTAIVRWLNVQIVDIWVVAFYALALYLVLKPEKKAVYFLKLGVAAGMVAGSKYSGPLYVGILFLFFLRPLLRKMNIKNAAVFLVPAIILGGFWYGRNYLVTGNPFYPLAVAGFPGVRDWALELPVWKAALTYPVSMASALISEYLVWSLFLFLAPLYILRRLVMKKFNAPALFMLLALVNLIAYLPLPNGESYRVHVSNLRYSYPVFLPLILGIFVWVKQKRKEEWLALTALAGMFFSLQVGYHPKLLFFYVVLLFIFWRKWGFKSLD